MSFIKDLYEVVADDQRSMSYQEIVDATTTERLASMETIIYGNWNAVLSTDAAKIHNEKDPNQVPGEQAQYQADSAKAQSQESVQDGLVQSGQSQTQADASNLQMKAQMVQSINGIMSMVINLLGRIIA